MSHRTTRDLPLHVPLLCRSVIPSYPIRIARLFSCDNSKINSPWSNAGEEHNVVSPAGLASSQNSINRKLSLPYNALGLRSKRGLLRPPRKLPLSRPAVCGLGETPSATARAPEDKRRFTIASRWKPNTTNSRLTFKKRGTTIAWFSLYRASESYLNFPSR